MIQWHVWNSSLASRRLTRQLLIGVAPCRAQSGKPAAARKGGLDGSLPELILDLRNQMDTGLAALISGVCG